ncbi:hypothetical protein CARUB_v10020827mg [Capsella rubella]|uniref:Phorbol-ester/DAG-type domain-containing protein n=1 Tax=Capsella rubella TaxID=81985 RepID=R0IFR7_9BRAS|nr:hypothetical protein CARUB_v10020827mg [Capsella rubella]
MTRGTNGEDCKTEKLENKLTVNVIEHTHVMMSWDTGNNNTSCGICEGNILSSSWKCETCYFFAHDSCVKLGRPSRHRLHLNHDLTLMSSYPTGVIMSCNTCKGEIRGFNLLCRICILITCMRCVVKFGELQRGQKVIGTTKVKCSMYVGSHHLFQVMVSNSYPTACTICDERLCSGKVLSCMECGEIYHPHCIETFREKLIHPIHSDHKLEIKMKVGSKCIACELNITKYGLFCSLCKASFHIKCREAVDDASGKNNV